MLEARKPVLGWALVGALGLAGSPGGSQGPAPEDMHERFRRMSRDAEARGLAEPFRGVTTDGKRRPRPLRPALDRRQHGARPPGRRRLPGFPDAGAAGAGGLPVRGRRVAQVDEPALLPAPGHRLQGHDGSTEGRRAGPPACLAQRAGPDAHARHHAAQHHAGRDQRRQLRRIRRGPVLHHRDGRAVRERAVGLAARRAPSDRQLLRAGRPGRHDAELLRLGAGGRPRGQIQGHGRPPGRAAEGPRPAPGVRRGAAQEGGARARQDRQQQPVRGLQGQRGRPLRRPARARR